MHNVLHCNQRTIESRSHATSKKIVKFEHAVFSHSIHTPGNVILLLLWVAMLLLTLLITRQPFLL